MKLGDAFIIPPGVMRASSLIVGVLVVALSYGGPTTGVAMANGRVAPESVAGGGNNYNVWPTRNPAVDVLNVQWAVDHVRPGGVVRLKGQNKFTGMPAAFNFGNDGSVKVTRSVSIKGEVDDAGNLLATIDGGNKPFTCDDPSIVLEISNLRFDGARRAAVYVRQSAAVTITGNVMVNLLAVRDIGYPNPLQVTTPPVKYDPLPYFAASGIEMGLLTCEHPAPAPPNACPDTVHLGSVEISDNFIDLGIYEKGNLVDPTIAYPNFRETDHAALEDTSFSGIVLVAADLEAKISGNTVKNTNRRAIHPLDTFGSTEIVGNTVVMSPFSSAAPGQTSSGGNGKRNFGIFPLNGNRNIDSANHGAVHTIVGNTVYLASDIGLVDGPHGNAILVINGQSDAVVSQNRVIYVAGARNGIVVAGNNSSVLFAKPLYTIIDHNVIDASSHPLDPSSTPAHILVFQANSTTIDTNSYLGALPRFVILGLGTGVVDSAHPNTIVDDKCGTSLISFANASCTLP